MGKKNTHRVKKNPDRRREIRECGWVADNMTEGEAIILEAVWTARRVERSWKAHDTHEAWTLLRQMVDAVEEGKTGDRKEFSGVAYPVAVAAARWVRYFLEDQKAWREGVKDGAESHRRALLAADALVIPGDEPAFATEDQATEKAADLLDSIRTRLGALMVELARAMGQKNNGVSLGDAINDTMTDRTRQDLPLLRGLPQDKEAQETAAGVFAMGMYGAANLPNVCYPNGTLDEPHIAHELFRGLQPIITAKGTGNASTAAFYVSLLLGEAVADFLKGGAQSDVSAE